MWECFLLAIIIYFPALHAPFGTYSLPVADWLVILPVALTVVPALEGAKSMVRRGWLGPTG
ncbi:MAG TPA: cation transporting ATPase C-terminal domain-containing protein [Gemmatimonadales bacterium]